MSHQASFFRACMASAHFFAPDSVREVSEQLSGSLSCPFFLEDLSEFPLGGLDPPLFGPFWSLLGGSLLADLGVCKTPVELLKEVIHAVLGLSKQVSCLFVVDKWRHVGLPLFP